MFLDNKYRAWYLSLMDKAKQRGVITGYVERHHIVPRSLGGPHTRENIVVLTYREHFLAHWLLTKFTAGSALKSMRLVMGHLARAKEGRIIASWQYAVAKTILRHSKLGTTTSDEVRAKMSIAMRNSQKARIALQRVQRDKDIAARKSVKMRAHHADPAYKKKLHLSMKNSEKVQQNMKVLCKGLIGNRHALGHKHDEESRRKMSEANRHSWTPERRRRQAEITRKRNLARGTRTRNSPGQLKLF